MSKLTPLQAKAAETVKTLEQAGLIRPEHALTIELLNTLCGAVATAASGAMVAALSKEIRACLAELPAPEIKTTDAAEDFLASLEDD
ncbi:hypothetical protein [Arthrobacter alpinus]|uniref:hypothetical protein n=1 Tax=Arthrobacter alpinus TaxID=656366 RepID=UPI0016456DA7|nr:hypothetical protein [Arthrobacter alpinus]